MMAVELEVVGPMVVVSKQNRILKWRGEPVSGGRVNQIVVAERFWKEELSLSDLEVAGCSVDANRTYHWAYGAMK